MGGRFCFASTVVLAYGVSDHLIAIAAVAGMERK